jgi:hypothetical protein
MCKLFEENRRELDELIDRTPCFTRYELRETFLTGRDPRTAPYIGGGGMSIESYLEDLRDAKLLGFQGGLYFHPTTSAAR